jgi:hypothetical protein
VSFPVPAITAVTTPWSLPDNSGPALDGPQVLWTVPASMSAQVGSVAMFLDYGEDAFTKDIYVLRLHDQGQNVMFTQASGVFDAAATTDGIIEATWAIGASDASQLPALVLESFNTTIFGGYATVPLPNMALPTSSFISLTAIRGLGNVDAHAVNISGIVSYTPAGGGTETQTPLTPLLLNQGNG